MYYVAVSDGDLVAIPLEWLASSRNFGQEFILHAWSKSISYVEFLPDRVMEEHL